jgi:uncharacterized short protein YbdD (DUF466 family)
MWRERLAGWTALAVRTARLMVGVPDYDTYVAHRAAHHPGEPVMSRAEFVAERQQARFSGRVGKCC